MSETPSVASAADPRKAVGAGCDVWGEKRLALALVVKDILNGRDSAPLVPWFIESGTLLGAWRTGRFIAHDDDFDIGVCLPDWDTAPTSLEALKVQILALLPAPYACRCVSTYCDKLEIYDPSQGQYQLLGEQYGGADYHYVTVDLQAYTPWPENPGTQMAPRYRAAPGGYQVVVDRAVLLPIGSIVLEGSEFPSPAKQEQFLTTMYGYLGQGARYCKATGFYLAPLGVEANIPRPTTP